MLETDDSFEKIRRNLLIISSMMLVFVYGQVKIDNEVNILFFHIIINKPLFIKYAMLVLSLYFLIRYVQFTLSKTSSYTNSGYSTFNIYYINLLLNIAKHLDKKYENFIPKIKYNYDMTKDNIKNRKIEKEIEESYKKAISNIYRKGFFQYQVRTQKKDKFGALENWQEEPISRLTIIKSILPAVYKTLLNKEIYDYTFPLYFSIFSIWSYILNTIKI